MAEVISARKAAEFIHDGATIGFGGMGMAGCPDEITQAIAERFLECGHPRDLALRTGCFLGNTKERGLKRLGIEGLVSKWSAAILGGDRSLCDLARAEKIECHCLPQGVIVNLWREIAAHRPGIITKVGLGTFVDPRLEGGRMNKCTKSDIAELITLNGKEYLFYKSFPVDFALIRGTYADEDGNITFCKDGMINEGLNIAMAARNTGGKVIVQVESIVPRDSIRPKEIHIPGILVDYIVVAQDEGSNWQTSGVYYEPSFSGESRKPLDLIPPMPLNERKVIARRCSMELSCGDVVNLGIGIPTDIASVAAEEGVSDLFILTTEAGSVGGVPASQPNFGSAYNPQATMTHGDMFDMISGGGLDVTCLGMGEADRFGNVNVSKFGPQIPGCGGFIDITSATKKIVFAGTFMAKAKLAFENGEVKVLSEGKYRKFVNDVEQVTFSGKYASPELEILYVTERCVFRLIDGRLVLTEVAPGIDIEQDIIPNMGFKPVISPDVKLMEQSIFHETWGGFKANFCKNINLK